MLSSRYSTHDLELAAALLNAALHLHLKGAPHEAGRPAARPFITVSRQSGAAGRSFARRLVERLNDISDEQAWSCWDQELVEKVSAEHEMDATIVEMMESRRHTWVQDLLDSLSTADARHHPDEFKLYRRVAMTIQALAIAGRAVIVGRGGVFVTAGMPAGIHLRIVAPVKHRITHMAERDGCSPEEAAAKVAAVERNREAFYRRHWPGRSLGPETFTLTLNSAEMSVEEMIDCVLSLVRAREPRQRSSGPRPIELTTTGGAQPGLPHVSQAGGV